MCSAVGAAALLKVAYCFVLPTPTGIKVLGSTTDPSLNYWHCP